MSVKSSPSDGRWDHMRKSLRSCPSCGPFYLTPPANRPLKFFAPDVWESCMGSEEQVVLLACKLMSLQMTAQLLWATRWERDWLQLVRAPSCYSFSFWSCSLVLSRSDWLLHCRYRIRSTCSRISAWGRDVLTPKCCCWGKWYQPCTQHAKLDRSVWTLNPLRHFSPPPGHCSMRICRIS